MAAAISERNWAAGLPAPLIGLIAERLSVGDFACFRSVCTSWASAVSASSAEEQPYRPRSLQCPWLMVPSENDKPTKSRVFLSLAESRSYRVNAPEIHGKQIIGSHDGWLAALDEECNMSLVNPLTHVQIPLPCITTHPAIEAVRDNSTGSPISFIEHFLHKPGLEPNVYPPEHFREIYFRKVILSSSPSSGDYVVVLFFGLEGRLAFSRAGDKSWTLLPLVPPVTYGYGDAVFLDRKLYAVTGNGEIQVFDFNEADPRPAVLAERLTPWCSSEDRFIVFSSGDLLQISRERDYDVSVPTTSVFTVERFDPMGEGKNCWIPIKDLGCQSVFLGLSQSVSVSTQEVPGLRENCIYFTDDNLDWFYCEEGSDSEGKQSIRDMGVYDLRKESFQPLHPPDAWLTWPPPIWFTPVLF